MHPEGFRICPMSGFEGSGSEEDDCSSSREEIRRRNDNHVISAFDDSYIYACISERVVTPHAHTLPTLLIMTANAKSIHNNADEKGNFNRQVSSFRDAIQPGGQFPPEKGMAATFI